MENPARHLAAGLPRRLSAAFHLFALGLIFINSVAQFCTGCIWHRRTVIIRQLLSTLGDHPSVLGPALSPHHPAPPERHRQAHFGSLFGHSSHTHAAHHQAPRRTLRQRTTPGTSLIPDDFHAAAATAAKHAPGRAGSNRRITQPPI